MNVVLIEDSVMIRMHLITLLASIKGVNVVGQASTEEDAIHVIGLVNPDLVLMDISLESGTGLNVLRKIRQAGNTSPVVMLTNHNESRFRQLATQLGADGYFDKSTQLEPLVAQIKEWLVVPPDAHTDPAKLVTSENPLLH